MSCQLFIIISEAFTKTKLIGKVAKCTDDSYMVCLGSAYILIIFHPLYRYCLLLQSIFIQENRTDEDDGGFESETSDSFSFASLGQDQPSQNVEKELLMVIFICSVTVLLDVKYIPYYRLSIRFIFHQVHLLRLACASRGPLADVLPQIVTELCNLGVCILTYSLLEK